MKKLQPSIYAQGGKLVYVCKLHHIHKQVCAHIAAKKSSLKEETITVNKPIKK